MRQTNANLFGAILLCLLLLVPGRVHGQNPTPTAVPIPAPNVLLLYNQDVLTLINVSMSPLSLNALTFMRAGGVVKYDPSTLIQTLPPGQCLQWWTPKVRQTPVKPPECGVRARFLRLTRDNTFFWVAGYEGEPFRPQLRGSALTICNASIGRCQFNLPQGADANLAWNVPDPATGLAMPAGIQVAYDNDQLWIGNVTPDTVLPLRDLRLIYTVNGQGVVWSPGRYPDQWDIGVWDNRPLLAGQCIVLYQDPAKLTPLLPCDPVAKLVKADRPWTLKFDVMGPREERRAPCGQGEPTPGPVLCLVGG
jgi:hypothetical protein